MRWVKNMFWFINTNTMPHLSIMTTNSPAQWHQGVLHLLMHKSRFLRISPRGVHFAFNVSLLLESNSHGWQSMSCRPSTDSLCVTEDNMHWFPHGEVVIPLSTLYEHGTGKYVNSFLTSLTNTSLCTSHNSNRVQRLSDQTYDVSLCDLVDGNLDIVYNVHSEELFWRRETTSTLFLMYMALVCLYALGCVTYDLSQLVQPTHNKTHDDDIDEHSVLRAWRSRHKKMILFLKQSARFVFSFVYLVLVSCLQHPHLLCREEQRVYAFLIVYTLTQCVFAVAHEYVLAYDYMRQDHFTTVTFFLQVLLISDMTLHHTIATPYFDIIMFLYLCRLWHRHLGYLLEATDDKTTNTLQQKTWSEYQFFRKYFYLPICHVSEILFVAMALDLKVCIDTPVYFNRVYSPVFLYLTSFLVVVLVLCTSKRHKND